MGETDLELDLEGCGERLRDRRKELDMTQEELADAARVNNTHISNIERNKATVSLKVFIKICQVLRVSMDYILFAKIPGLEAGLETEIILNVRTMKKDDRQRFYDISKSFVDKDT